MHFIQSARIRKLVLLYCLLSAPSIHGEDIDVDVCMDFQQYLPDELRNPMGEFAFGGPKCDGKDSGKHKRTAIVHLPDALPEDRGVALVLNIHALGSSAKGQQSYTKFDDVADKEKFVVVYPEGYSKAKLGTPFPAPRGQDLFSFNAGGCCSDVPIDDIGFFRELIKEVVGTVAKEHKFQIDPTRIYVTGMSNGGFMTNRVACEMSDIVAAAAPVAGPLMNVGVEDHPFGWGSDGFECKPGRPVPILHMHSSKDLAVPFGGSALNVADFKEDLKVPGIFIFPLDPLIGLPTLGFPSVDASIDNWRKINNVTPASKDVTPRKASKDITCTLYSQPLLKSLPSATVELCVTDTNEPGGLGHCWPGEGRGQCGKKGVDNPYIWDFFKKHTHPNPKLDHDEL